MQINFRNLQKTYNSMIDLMLADNGLTTNCTLVYGISKKNICPNCIFDSLTGKSSNQYKTNGPIPFEQNIICTYCYGIGYVGEETSEENTYLAVIWDSKKWINFNTDIKDTDNYIQTIASSKLLSKLESVNYILVNGQKFEIQQGSAYSGLGDSNYIILTWRKIL